MSQYLLHRARRYGFDGWALRVKGAQNPIVSTTCTTRQEVRDLLKNSHYNEDFWRNKLEIVKVRIGVTAVKEHA